MNYNQKHRPIRPGLKIGNGSIGFFVVYEDKRYLATATHILGLEREGVSINQPTTSLDKIATVDKLFKTNQDEYVPDFALALIKPHIRASNKLIESGLKPEQILEPEVGMEIIAIGRNSGEVKGEITHIDRDVMFNHARRAALFSHTAEMQPGDSGGGIICVDPPAIVGLNVSPRLGQSVFCALEMMGLEGVKPLTMDIELEIGNKKLKTADGEKEMDVEPFIKDGRTFVPLRFVSEALGARVDWEPKEGKTKEVYIYR